MPFLCRVVILRNIPREIVVDEVYGICSPYGEVVQIRMGVSRENSGSAFIVYRRVEDAVLAVKSLDGRREGDSYISARYLQPGDLLRGDSNSPALCVAEKYEKVLE